MSQDSSFFAVPAGKRRSSEVLPNETHNFTLSQYSLQASQGQDADEGYKIIFVLITGQTKDTCPTAISDIFKLCVNRGVACAWMEEKAVFDKVPSASNVFVLQHFDGPLYNYLEEQFFALNYFMIIGPQCLRYIFQRSEDEILHRGHPMLTLGMKNILVTLSGFKDKDKARADELVTMIRRMGGVTSNLYTMATTHIVSDNVLSEKCAAAYANKRPVMKPDWVYEVWKQSQVDIVHATDRQFTGMECPIFYKLKICMSQIPNSSKGTLRKIIEDNGGTYSADLIRRQVSVLLILRGEGDKFRHSVQWGIPCVSPAWVHESEKAGHVLPFTEFLVSGKDHPLSSTPTDSDKLKLPDLTTCSIILSTEVNVIDATISSRESMMSDYNRDVIQNGGNFLDGCRVYICGCDNLAQAKKLLNGSGSTRLDRLTENVSHVIVLGPRVPEKDIQTLKTFENMPHIVGMEWLTESARRGSPADEELFAFQTPEQQRAKSKSISPTSTNLADEVQRLGISGNQTSQLVNRNLLNTSAFDEEMTEDPTRSPGQSFKSDGAGSVCTVVEEKGIFAGKKFYLMLEEEADYERISEMIKEAGGKVVKKMSPEIDYTILPVLHSHPEVLQLPHFTEYWILDCIESEKPDIEIECYHRPLLKYVGAEKVLDKVVLAISSYSVMEKKYMIEVGLYLGAINQDVFSRKGAPKSGISASTHLLCPSSTTDKYKAAVKWGVPVIRYEWIVACFNARKKLEISPFIVTEESSIDESVLAATPKQLNRAASSSRVSSARSLYTSTLKNATITGMGMNNAPGNNLKTHSPVIPVHVPTAPSPTTPSGMGPPLNTPLRKKLSMGSESDAEFTPTQSQSQVTPNRSLNLDLVKNRFPAVSEADISLGFSPNEVRKMMGFCGVLPSPETPKFVEKVWKTYIDGLGKKTPDENEAPGPIIQPVPWNANLSNLQQENMIVDTEEHAFAKPMETSRDASVIMNEIQCLEKTGGLGKGKKRDSDSLSDDESNEEMLANKNDAGSRKKPRSSTEEISPEDVYALFGKPVVEPKSKQRASSSAASRKASLTGYNPLKVKKVATSSAGASDSIDGKTAGSQYSSAFEGITKDVDTDAADEEEESVAAEFSKQVTRNDSSSMSVLDKVFVHIIAKKFEDILLELEATLTHLGAKIVEDVNHPKLTHIIFQGKPNQFSRDMRNRIKTDPMVHIVSPDWVWACDEKQTKVSEVLHEYSKYDHVASLKNLRRDSSLAKVVPRHTRSSSAVAQANTREESAEETSPPPLPRSAKSLEELGKFVSTVVTEKRLKGQSESSSKLKPSTELPLVTDGKLVRLNMDSNVGWDLESDPTEQNRRQKRAEQEAEEALQAEMKKLASKPPTARDSKKNKGSSEKQKGHEWIFLLSGFSSDKDKDKEIINKATALAYIQELGGREESKYENRVTMLIASALTRSEKLLCCVASGTAICRPTYIVDSHKAGEFLPITDEYLWSEADTENSYEKTIANGFRIWYDRIQADPSNKPLHDKNVLLLERDKTRFDSYKRLIIAGGGFLVPQADIDMADIIICDKTDLKKLPRSTSVQVRHREAAFLSDILVKDQNLLADF